MYKTTLKFYTFLGLFVFILTNEINSQSLLTKDAIGLKSGTFSRKTVRYFTPGDSGTDCLWDFSNLDISPTSHNVVQEIDSLGQMVITDDRQITYYMTREDSLFETGSETPLKKVVYYEPLCRMKYPMTFEDSISKAFEGYGVYCGDHYFKETGVCNIVVDGLGNIVLSETDTLKNAFRVYKLKLYSIAMDMEPSKIDSARLKQVIEEKYEWYVKGYNKPVFESVTSTSYANLNPIGTTQFAYCSLTETLLCNRDKRLHGNAKDESDKERQLLFTDIIHYSVNYDGNLVNIDYSLDAKANVTMILANSMGIIYDSKRYTQDKGSEYHVDFHLGGLRPDLYVLYINVNGKVYNEKIKK